jgi:hypothetical protein
MQVTRCKIESLMKHLGLHGVHRGKVNRQFKSPRPNQLRVSNFTHINGRRTGTGGHRTKGEQPQQ